MGKTKNETITLEVNHIETGNVAEVDVSFDYWYDPGIWYSSDGSGCPPDSGFEIKNWEMSTGEDAPEWLNETLIENALQKAFEDGRI